MNACVHVHACVCVCVHGKAAKAKHKELNGGLFEGGGGGGGGVRGGQFATLLLPASEEIHISSVYKLKERYGLESRVWFLGKTLLERIP